MAGTSSRARKRAAAALPALALVASGLAATGAGGMATAAPEGAETSIDASEYYINYAEPHVEEAFGDDVEVVKGVEAQKAAIAKATAVDEKFSSGNPVAARGLAKLEAKSIETGKSPKELKNRFKSAKSIVRIRLVSEQPKTAWEKAAPSEYGFYSNVNPAVSHPRWSQADERRIGEFRRRPTLPFNGYADQVASLYTGMDLKKYY